MRIKNLETSDYILFLTNEFSQWYPSAFTSKDGLAFNCAEQYMMHQKALLFGDAKTAAKIMQAQTPDEQKQLGREVKGFDKDIWDAHAQDIVYRGNYYKFTQNPHLFDVLMATAPKQLVEAAHYDPVWGIGLRADDPLARDKANWKGKNWLGGTLTKLRDDLTAQGFSPAGRQPMVKFYDEDGQRTLYIPAAELAAQWLKEASAEDAATAAPENPVAWMIDQAKKTIAFERSRPLCMGDDPDIDPTYVIADIKSHGTVRTTARLFESLNRDLLFGPPAKRPAPDIYNNRFRS